ncbi:MAG: hypothetical protein LC808_27005 [Actinobacteria bacterium]|nr:hypothetical protein [Actinomycetota bacterium]
MHRKNLAVMTVHPSVAGRQIVFLEALLDPRNRRAELARDLFECQPTREIKVLQFTLTDPAMFLGRAERDAGVDEASAHSLASHIELLCDLFLA